MKRFLKISKWLIFTIIFLLIASVLTLRLSRFSDKMIYQTNDSHYTEFYSELNFDEFYFEIEKDVKLHGVLFKPDSRPAKATIFHFSGKGMHLMTSIQDMYKPLLDEGFQIFCYERRGFGKSNGLATNSLLLKKDALDIFDQVSEMSSVSKKPIILWGQSLGGAFATMTAKAKEDRLSGLLLEGTFSSFPDIGKVYAGALNLENFKWVVPLLMNNDFPAMKEIQGLSIPTVIIHSKIDKQVPYELGRKLYESADKSNTNFWEIDGKHIRGMFDYEQSYISTFNELLEN